MGPIWKPLSPCHLFCWLSIALLAKHNFWTTIPIINGEYRIYRVKIDSQEKNVLLVPGFAETIRHTKPVADALGKLGYNTLTFSPPRKLNDSSSKSQHPIDRQAQIVLSILEDLEELSQPIHVVAHSLGSAVALRAASLKPHYFKSLTLMQPVGLAGYQTLADLLVRSSKKQVNNYRLIKMVDQEDSHIGYRSHVTSAQFASLKNISKQPLLAFKEGVAAGRYDILKDLIYIQELGIEVHIIVSTHDEYFDYHKMQPTISKLQGLAKTLTILNDERYGHDTFWINPGQTARLFANTQRVKIK